VAKGSIMTNFSGVLKDAILPIILIKSVVILVILIFSSIVKLAKYGYGTMEKTCTKKPFCIGKIVIFR
jgi:hypothetical protein